jgi:DNA-directed RNA polymerase specialized sigma24 family protein
VAQARGKLRAFLMATMKNFIAKEHRYSTADKRGGGFVVSIDQVRAERRLAGEPSDHRSPDALFDQSWSYAVLDGAMKRLADWYALKKRTDLFQAIREFISGHHGEQSYVEVAERLGISGPALRATIHQMRKRYRGMIEEEIASTVSSRDEALMELEHLQQVLAGNFAASLK